MDRKLRVLGLVRAVTTAALLSLLSLLAVSCGSDTAVTAGDQDVSTPVATTTEAPTASGETETPVPTNASTPLPTAASDTDATPAPTADPALDPTPAAADPQDGFPEWLRVNGFGPVDFGADRAAIEAAMEARFGPPDSVNELAECGAGPITALNYDEFTLNTQDDELVGWYFEGSTPQLTSPSGVTPGISRADMETIYVGVDISDTTLGTEFFFEVPAGFMGGFISEDGTTVTAMYAGTTCFFR